MQQWTTVQDFWEVTREGQIRHKSNKKILKLRTRKDGYVDVKLSYRRFLLHRLVAIAFIPNPLQYQQVNHKNGIRSDYRVENLEWVDQFQNMKHAVKTGLFSSRKGEANANATITEKEAYEIKKMLKTGVSVKKIATLLKVSIWIIYNIKSNITWKHVAI